MTTTHRPRARGRAARGFTLVELIVVLAIVALLVALLVPVFASVRAQARAAGSMSNLRQWGLGTMQFAVDEQGRLPWEGYKNANQMPGNFNQKLWWANCVPPYVGQKPYSEVSDEATAAGLQVPLPPQSESIFLDPSAQVPSNAPYTGGGKKFFFCYVPNAQLDNTLEERLVADGVTDPLAVRMRLSQLKNAASTVLMMEIRTVKQELPPEDPWFNEPLNRHYGDWKRFSARHRDGGHMLFGDGHAALVDNVFATTNVAGNRDPDAPGGDWNKPQLVWDPLGPAPD